MNKKGMTLMEVLVSLILISIVMVFLVNLLSDLKSEDVISTKRNQDALTRASLINVIEGDLVNKSLVNFSSSCDQKPSDVVCYQFNYSDVTKYLYVNANFIAYGILNSMEKWDINYGTYDINNIAVYELNNIGGSYTPEYLLTIHIPVTGVDTTNKRKYDVDITYLGSNKTTWNYDFTGSETTLTVPRSGRYKLEVWGAQGSGTLDGSGGYGGYSVGYVNLNENDTLYINVGGQSGYNGGGAGQASGGGATHIATTSGKLSSLSSKKNNILIVAGGGGGAERENGGSGGGYIGGTGYLGYNNNTYPWYANGGNQSRAGSGVVGNSYAFSTTGNGGFGYGGSGLSSGDNGAGGGGGYFGGGAVTYAGGAGGGSGYIGNSKLYDKSMYCYNCATSNDTNTKTISTTNVSNTATSNYAKMGNGYAKITYVENVANQDMGTWNALYSSRFSISYNSTTKTNTISVSTNSGWEILYYPISTTIGQKYTISFDYEILNNYSPLNGSYSGIGYQILNSISDSDNLSNSVYTGYFPTSTTSTKKVTFSFTATSTTSYLAFNFGMASDYVTDTIKIGNIQY